jgi:hypothetical protein
VINEFKGNQGLVFYGGFKYSDLVYQKFLEAFGFDGCGLGGRMYM